MRAAVSSGSCDPGTAPGPPFRRIRPFKGPRGSGTDFRGALFVSRGHSAMTSQCTAVSATRSSPSGGRAGAERGLLSTLWTRNPAPAQLELFRDTARS